MPNGLSVSDVVSVSVSLSPTAAQTENFGSLLLVGSSNVIDTNERIRKYSNLTSVAGDFGTNAPEYLAADLFFSQSPQPSTLFVGRWAQSATQGKLIGASLTKTQQTLSNFTAITNGGLEVTVDGTSDLPITGISFSSATSLGDVAATLNTAMGGSATVAYNATYSRFEVTSATSGLTSSVSFASDPDGYTALSALLGLTAAAGAKTIAGVDAESLLSGVSTLTALSNDFYGVALAYANPAKADVEAVADFIEGVGSRRFFVATTQESEALDPASTTDLAYVLANKKLTHTAVQYSSSSPYAGVSLFARMASVDFTAQNSTISLMFKSEPGVAAETLTESQAAALAAKNCNVFINYSNSTAIIQNGTVCSGGFIDTTVGLDWLQNALQTAVFNLLYQSTTKIPQTDAGVNMIVSTVSAVMDQAANNLLIAPGVWQGSPIGALNTGQTLSTGYYVYAPKVSSQSAADRAARKSPTLQVAAKLGGAIHEAGVVVNVNQ